jgi:hypothetical protein
MAMDSNDPLPLGISPAEAYARIRSWYQANVVRVEARHDEYAKKSAAYIRGMKAAPSATEMQDAFTQVLTGLLEWAYHESDGRYKMAAYASVAGI